MKLEGFDSLVSKGRQLLKERAPVGAHYAFEKWEQEVADWLENRFPGSVFVAQWSILDSSALVGPGGYRNDRVTWDHFRGVVRQRLSWLSKLALAAQGIDRTEAGAPVSLKPNGKVFVVHGQNEALRESVAGFIKKLELTPVILHEQPSQGRTIIEKFMDYSDVSFAVVLLTGDDRGGLASLPPEEQKLRARQNVILELGFFLGKLGRKSVCLIYETGVEIPSDYQGVLYVELDSAGAWKQSLAKEMKAAGLPVDMNKVL